MEADLDKITDNKVNWVKITQNVYDAFHPQSNLKMILILKNHIKKDKSWENTKENVPY